MRVRPARPVNATRAGIAFLAAFVALLRPQPAAPTGSGVPDLAPRRPRVVATHPHDPESFTQGLVWSRGRLFESSGLYGQSRLIEVELATGRALRQVALPQDEFAEGLALVGDRLFQLTWREGRAHLWRADDLAPLGVLSFAGEGWGLTWDGVHLVLSDGSAALSFRSPEDLREVRRLIVRRAGRAVPYLNELEWAEGAIYANVWMSDEILRIDPATGEVTAVWDAAGLLTPDERRRADVLNGLAWVPERRTFLVTGKLWPRTFELELAGPGTP